MDKPGGARFLLGANPFAAQSVVLCPLDLAGMAPFLQRHTPASFQAFCEEHFADHGDAPPLSGSVTETFARQILAIIISLQRRAQTDGALFTHYEITDQSSVVIVFGFERTEIATAAMQYALGLIHRAVSGSDAANDAYAAVSRQFERVAETFTSKFSVHAVVEAARARGIAADRLGRGLVIYGEGRFQQRRLRGFSDRTSHISVGLTSDKSAALQLLASRGLPVPQQSLTRSPDDGIRAAAAIGYPVVVKPLGGDFGQGVSLNLMKAEDVRRAWSRAAKFGPNVLVERQIPGTDHRLLVIDGRFYGAARRRIPIVIGDGNRDVRALIADLNADPDRGSVSSNWIVRIDADEETATVLAEQEHTFETVPADGDVVRLRRVPTVSDGATAEDVSALVHPDNVALAEWSAALFDIDVCGIDFVSPDISCSYRENGAAICEVNTSPGLGPHVAAGDDALVGRIVETIFPPGAPFAVRKLVLIADAASEEVIAVARAVADLLTRAGACVGLAAFGQTSVDGIALVGGARELPHAARALIGHPAVDTIVLLCTPQDIVDHGLGITACDIAVLLCGDGDAFAQPARGAIERVISIAGDVVRESDTGAILAAIERRFEPVPAGT